jgi:hypothetical protein
MRKAIANDKRLRAKKVVLTARYANAVCLLTPSFVGRCPPPPQGERSSPQGYPSFSIVAERVKGYAKLLGGLRQLPFFGVTAIAQVSKRTEVRQQFSDRSTQGW